MFGHQDEPVQPTTSEQPAASPAPDTSVAAPTSFGPSPTVTPVSDTNYLLDAQADDGQTGAPAVATSDWSAPAPAEPTTPEVSTAAPSAPALDAPAGGSDALLTLKQQALQQLSPLVDQLEQSPEEKFRTTMMMIQASDNQELLQSAYDAANQIPDEKARAQALLDVINEINYFSQSHGK